MRAVIVNGSGTYGSSNDAIVSDFLFELEQVGAQAEVICVFESGIPLVIDEAHPSVQNVRRIVSESDVVILVTPLYHGSFSGIMKLFLDQLERDAFGGKRLVLVSNSSKLRNAQVAAHDLMTVAWTMKAQVHKLIGVSSADFTKNDDGTRVLTDQDVKARIARIVNELSTGTLR